MQDTGQVLQFGQKRRHPGDFFFQKGILSQLAVNFSLIIYQGNIIVAVEKNAFRKNLVFFHHSGDPQDGIENAVVLHGDFFSQLNVLHVHPQNQRHIRYGHTALAAAVFRLCGYLRFQNLHLLNRGTACPVILLVLLTFPVFFLLFFQSLLLFGFLAQRFQFLASRFRIQNLALLLGLRLHHVAVLVKIHFLAVPGHITHNLFFIHMDPDGMRIQHFQVKGLHKGYILRLLMSVKPYGQQGIAVQRRSHGHLADLLVRIAGTSHHGNAVHLKQCKK